MRGSPAAARKDNGTAQAARARPSNSKRLSPTHCAREMRGTAGGCWLGARTGNSIMLNLIPLLKRIRIGRFRDKQFLSVCLDKISARGLAGRILENRKLKCRTPFRSRLI
jgi:hypothetical protein